MKRAPMDPDLRDRVLRRDNYSCQARRIGFAPELKCSFGMHVHHRRLRKQGGEDSMENLMTLCGAHHDWAHTVDRAGAERFGIIVRGIPPSGG